jgi:hypothetical protein
MATSRRRPTTDMLRVNRGTISARSHGGVMRPAVAIRTSAGRRLAGALSSSLVLALSVPAGASALTYVADASIPDTDASTCVAQENSGGVCSLRRAIVAADAADGNTVIVNAGTYAITQGAVPAVGAPTHAMSIQGASAATTIIDGAGNGTSPFLLPATTTGTLSLSGLTVQNFHGTGAIRYFGAGGALSLSRMVFDHNVAPNGGGAIYYLPNPGATLTISSSTFSSNRATSGSAGAVYAQFSASNISIDSSTFMNNSAGDAGGALLLVGTMGSTATATNSTFAGNTAAASGGGAIYLAGAANTSLTLGFDTFTGNGAPPGAGLSLEVGNNLVARSITGSIFAGAAGQCSLGGNTSFADGGSNLSSDTSCGLTAGGDQQGVDPKLLPLGSYGGPTQTAALGVGSPAVNAALTCPVSGVDQRGVARPQGAACDIGAFEARPPTLAGTPTLTGTATVGNTLTCVPPAVTSPDGTPVTTLTFSRDGTAFATGSTYQLTAADQAHAISCTFTAATAGGSVSASSSAVTVGAPAPPPPPTPPPPVERVQVDRRAHHHCRFARVHAHRPGRRLVLRARDHPCSRQGEAGHEARHHQPAHVRLGFRQGDPRGLGDGDGAREQRGSTPAPQGASRDRQGADHVHPHRRTGPHDHDEHHDQTQQEDTLTTRPVLAASVGPAAGVE